MTAPHVVVAFVDDAITIAIGAAVGNNTTSERFLPQHEVGRINGLIVVVVAVDVVRISDTGRGIPQEELDDVFVKFFRSPGVQTDAIPGTGIGLAISKAIVEAHGGTIDLTSKVGVGTTFEIRLPLAGQRVARPA